MWSIGFGLEKIGIVALRRPVLFSLLLALAIIVSLSQFPNIRFDGNITSVLPKSSDAFVKYDEQKSAFRDFSRDIAVIVRSPRLLTAQGLEDLRSLQLDLTLSDGVDSIITMFSVPKPDQDTGNIVPYFPDDLGGDENARKLVDQLLRENPQAASLISPDKNTALLFVSLESGMQDKGDQSLYRMYQSFRKSALEAAPKDFEVHFSGLTPIGLTIIQALIEDQVKLTLIGLLLGAGIAFAVFRSVMAALICAIPPALTAVWILGMFALAEVPINYLTTVLPTLGLILAYADSIVLYYRWHKSNSETPDGDQNSMLANLKNAVNRVGPASSLTSITTALAFFSFSYASSHALTEFAYLGVGAVCLAFFAVIVGMPVAGHWLVKFGMIKPSNARLPMFDNFGHWAFGIASRRPVLISTIIVGVIAALAFVHVSIRPEYRITDYLPVASDSYKAEQLANDVFGGRSLIFLSVPIVNKENLSASENIKRLVEVETALRTQFEARNISSLNLLWKNFKTDEARKKVTDAITMTNLGNRQGYLSADGSSMLVSVRIPSDQSIKKTLEQLEQIKKISETFEFGDETKISGFPVLMAQEFTHLIEQLRTSLLIAIGLGILVVGIATRSPLMMFAALTPNLLPILGVELILYLRGAAINMSEVIALTVAFGIAIDNAVHVINVYESEKNNAGSILEAIEKTLAEVGPALASSTLIICVSTLVTFSSALPVVPVLGQLIIATLILALFANLVILPANILTLCRIIKRR